MSPAWVTHDLFAKSSKLFQSGSSFGVITCFPSSCGFSTDQDILYLVSNCPLSPSNSKSRLSFTVKVVYIALKQNVCPEKYPWNGLHVIVFANIYFGFTFGIIRLRLALASSEFHFLPDITRAGISLLLASTR